MAKEMNSPPSIDGLSFESVVGSSTRMRSIVSTMEKIATTEVPVVISGESGTGKEFIARVIHSASGRSGGSFVPLDCNVLGDTRAKNALFGNEKGTFNGAIAYHRREFESAINGTLLLHNIGEWPAGLQIAILRFLQETAVDRGRNPQGVQLPTRVIATSQEDISVAVTEGRFREDLYFYLAVVSIELPSLRNRGNDVIELARHFVESLAEELKRPPRKLTTSALTALTEHHWPGNVRELQNRIKRALVLADGPWLTPDDLGLRGASQVPVAPEMTLREAREQLERKIVARTLYEMNRNVSKTAKALGISRPTLYGLMSRYGLSEPGRNSRFNVNGGSSSLVSKEAE